MDRRGHRTEECEEWSAALVIAVPNTILSTIVTRYLRASVIIQNSTTGRRGRPSYMHTYYSVAVLYRRFCIIRECNKKTMPEERKSIHLPWGRKKTYLSRFVQCRRQLGRSSYSTFILVSTNKVRYLLKHVTVLITVLVQVYYISKFQ